MEPPDPMLHNVKDPKRRFWLTCEWWMCVIIFSPVIIYGIYQDWRKRRREEKKK